MLAAVCVSAVCAGAEIDLRNIIGKLGFFLSGLVTSATPPSCSSSRAASSNDCSSASGKSKDSLRGG